MAAAVRGDSHRQRQQHRGAPDRVGAADVPDAAARVVGVVCRAEDHAAADAQRAAVRGVRSGRGTASPARRDQASGEGWLPRLGARRRPHRAAQARATGQAAGGLVRAAGESPPHLVPQSCAPSAHRSLPPLGPELTGAMPPLPISRDHPWDHSHSRYPCALWPVRGLIRMRLRSRQTAACAGVTSLEDASADDIAALEAALAASKR
eukprot:3070595-Prymnesium_polylepis.1